MKVLKAEMKSTNRITKDPHISPWFVQMLEDVVQSHVCSVSKVQGAQQGSSKVLQVGQHEPLK